MINSSFILQLRSDGSDKYTDQLDGAFIVWFSIDKRLTQCTLYWTIATYVEKTIKLYIFQWIMKQWQFNVVKNIYIYYTTVCILRIFSEVFLVGILM